MGSLKNINKSIRKSGAKNSNDFLTSFLDREDELLNVLKHFTGTKSEIYLKEVNKELTNLVRFSSLFSDLTLLNITPSSIAESHFTYHDAESKYFRERQLTIPSYYVNEIGTDARRFLPCYIHRSDSETKKIFKEFTPFIKSDRLIVRPLRGLYVNFPELQQGTLYYVDPNTPNEHWYVNKIEQSTSIIVDNGLKTSNVTDLFEVTLPYFENIDLATLDKILTDENEILSTFRHKLLEVIKAIGNDPQKIEQIKNDITHSSIERLNRKFRAIQSKHRFVIGASIGTFVLTLSLGNIDLESVMKSLGVSISAMGISDRDFKSKVEDLKDDPFYLLWRMSRKK